MKEQEEEDLPDKISSIEEQVLEWGEQEVLQWLSTE